MTVYGKKKESSSKNSKETTSKSSTHPHPATSNPNPHPHPCTNPPASTGQEGEVIPVGIGRDQSENLAIPTYDPQADPVNVSLRSWSPGLPLGLGVGVGVVGSGPELRGVPHPHNQTHFHSHNEGSGHPGKRRHTNRISPVRTTRSKLSRVDRERASTTGSPNYDPGVGVIVSSNVAFPHSQPVPPVEPTSNVCLPLVPPSPELCNSEDEYESRQQSQLTEEEWVEREKRFEKKMRKKGLVIKKMGEDGACLFRAVSDQIYGDQDMHGVVRKQCMDYIAANGDYYSQYVTEDFKHYVSRKRLDHVHGNHIEIQAMSEMFNRTIEVFCYSTEPINTFHGNHKTDNAPIRLSYHRGIHYNSLIDPYNATIGVGLGLPGNQPGLADKKLLSDVARQSEEIHIEQAMLEDKLRATDWEATNEAIEEQVARESYLQWLKDNERRARGSRPATASSSSATVTSCSTTDIRSSRSKSTGGNISPIGSPYRGDGNHRPTTIASPRHSPPPSTPGPSRKINSSPNPHSSTSSPNSSNQTSTVTSDSGNATLSPNVFQYVDPSVIVDDLPNFDLNEWEDASLLAQVMAASQQEYFDQIKRSRETNPNSEANNSVCSSLSCGDLGADSINSVLDPKS